MNISELIILQSVLFELLSLFFFFFSLSLSLSLSLHQSICFTHSFVYILFVFLRTSPFDGEISYDVNLISLHDDNNYIKIVFSTD